MPQTVEVRFKGTRRAFFIWPHDDDPLRLQEPVIVDVERGQDFGRVNSVGEVAAKKCGGSCSCPVSPAPSEKVVETAAGETAADGADETGEKKAGEADETGTLLVQAGSPDAAASDSPDLPVPPDVVPPEVVPAPALPSIVRRAQQPDLAQANELRRAEEDDRRRIATKAREHGLEMKVSDVEWQFDRRRLTVYFTAEQRVDFRALVRDLAQTFRTRIELRQIGVRDEAARLGGVGRCGRAFCCSTWLTELSPVNLVLAKDQHLSLNPQQISGGCGRLLCCLKYEHEFYVASRKRFPREGKTLTTLHGAEKVVAVDIFRERVFLRGAEEQRIIGLAELREEIERAEGTAKGAGEAGKPDGADKLGATGRAGRADKPAPSAVEGSGNTGNTGDAARRERQPRPNGAPGTSPSSASAPTSPSSPSSASSATSPTEPTSPSSPTSPTSPSSSRRRRRRRRRNPPPSHEG